MMHKIFGFLVVVVALVSCNSSDEVVTTSSFANATWQKDNVQKLKFKVEDHQRSKNIIFVVRNNDDYPYSNLRLIGSIVDENNKVLTKDTLNYVLAKPNGQWLGSGFGDTKEIAFHYKSDFKFPKNGLYTVDVIQAMRHDALPGIEDIGVKISNVKP